jgi:hypothetical protein
MNILTTLPSDLVTVQHVDTVPDAPAWLDGTPILVDSRESKIYKGSHALAHLRALRDEPPPREAEPADASHPSGLEFDPRIETVDDTVGKVTAAEIKALEQERERFQATGMQS